MHCRQLRAVADERLRHAPTRIAAVLTAQDIQDAEQPTGAVAALRGVLRKGVAVTKLALYMCAACEGSAATCSSARSEGSSSGEGSVDVPGLAAVLRMLWEAAPARIQGLELHFGTGTFSLEPCLLEAIGEAGPQCTSLDISATDFTGSVYIGSSAEGWALAVSSLPAGLQHLGLSLTLAAGSSFWQQLGAWLLQPLLCRCAPSLRSLHMACMDRDGLPAPLPSMLTLEAPATVAPPVECRESSPPMSTGSPSPEPDPMLDSPPRFSADFDAAAAAAASAAAGDFVGPAAAILPPMDVGAVATVTSAAVAAAAAPAGAALRRLCGHSLLLFGQPLRDLLLLQLHSLSLGSPSMRLGTAEVALLGMVKGGLRKLSLQGVTYSGGHALLTAVSQLEGLRALQVSSKQVDVWLDNTQPGPSQGLALTRLSHLSLTSDLPDGHLSKLLTQVWQGEGLGVLGASWQEMEILLSLPSLPRRSRSHAASHAAHPPPPHISSSNPPSCHPPSCLDPAQGWVRPDCHIQLAGCSIYPHKGNAEGRLLAADLAALAAHLGGVSFCFLDSHGNSCAEVPGGVALLNRLQHELDFGTCAGIPEGLHALGCQKLVLRMNMDRLHYAAPAALWACMDGLQVLGFERRSLPMVQAFAQAAQQLAEQGLLDSLQRVLLLGVDVGKTGRWDADAFTCLEWECLPMLAQVLLPRGVAIELVPDLAAPGVQAHRYDSLVARVREQVWELTVDAEGSVTNKRVDPSGLRLVLGGCTSFCRA